MPRPKHRRDKNHGKNGWVAGNARYKRVKLDRKMGRASASRV